MKAIDEVIASNLAAIAEVRRRRRDERIARYGFAADVDCAECGDTGMDPDGRDVPCPVCARGRAIAGSRTRLASWAQTCPPRYAELTIDTHPDRSARRAVADWMELAIERGTNLMISGPTGTGKTGLALAALREMHIAHERTVRFGTMPDLMAALRPDDARIARDERATVEQLQRVQVLLLDDLGAERPTEWQSEQLYRVIDGRYQRGLPTIITTNLASVEDRVGPRTMSRFRADSIAVALIGPDLRRRRRAAS